MGISHTRKEVEDKLMLQQQPVARAVPQTPRVQKPSVKDPRLIVGILLVAVSVLLGAWAVDGAKNLSVAYVARETIVAGQELTQEQLRPVDVNLGQYESAYLTVPLDAAEELVARETIRAGELVSRAEISNKSVLEQRIVAVHSSTPLPNTLKVGSLLDLWVVSQADSEVDAEPSLVVSSLTVSELPDSEGSFSSSSGQSVHLVVQGADIPKVLDVISPGYTLALLAQPGDQ